MVLSPKTTTFCVTGYRSASRSLDSFAFRRSCLESLEDRRMLTGDPVLAWQPPSNAISASDGHFLGDFSLAPPLDIGQAFLRENAQEFGVADTTFDDFVVTDQYRSPGMRATHVYLQQTFNQIPVERARASVHFAMMGAC